MADLFAHGADHDDSPSDDPVMKIIRQIETLRREIESVRSAATAPRKEPAPPRATAAESSGAAMIAQVARNIERLRAGRARKGRDPSIAPLVVSMRDAAARTHRRLGELIDLWEALVPEEVAQQTSLTSYRGGILHVAVPSSSVAYELDRRLREGLTAELRRRFRGTLTRVKVRIAGPA